MFATLISFGDMLYALNGNDIVYCKNFKLTFDSSYSYSSLSSGSTFPVYARFGDILLEVDPLSNAEIGRGFRINETHFEFTNTTGSVEILDTTNFAEYDMTSTNPFCRSRVDSYFAIYRIYLASFNFDDFRKTPLTTACFVVVTFVALIMLLNLLIAIIETSYTQSVQKADRLFGRARLDFISRSVALEDLLHPRFGGHGGNLQQLQCLDPRSVCNDMILHQILRVLSFSLLAITTTVWWWLSITLASRMFPSPNTPASEVVVVIALAVIGTLPAFVILTYLYAGWDPERIPTQEYRGLNGVFNFFAHLLDESKISTIFGRFMFFVARIALGLPSCEEDSLLESDDEDKTKTPEEKRLELIVQGLEDKIESMESTLADRIDSVLNDVESDLMASIYDAE